MKNRKIFAAVIVFVLSLGILSFGVVSAHSFRTGNNVTVPQNEKIDQSLFVGGNTVDISSEVFGDVICAGQTVNITGTVHGDVICAGQTVNVSGKVDGDIRLAGQSVNVSAVVDGNASVGGQSFTLQSNGAIKGDAIIGSSTTTINGPVGRDLAVGGQTVLINNSIGRNIRAGITNIEFSSSARVKGNVDYTSNNDLTKKDGAEIAGTVTKSMPPTKKESKRGAVFGLAFMWFLYLFSALLLIAITLALLFPSMLQAVSNQVFPRPWKALLTGLLVSFFAPLVLVLLAITVVGIPLALLAGLSWMLVLVLSGPLFAFYIGRLILKDSNNVIITMLMGSTVLLLLYFVPFIGFITLIAASWVGSGMILLEVFHRTPKPAYTSSHKANPKKK